MSMDRRPTHCFKFLGLTSGLILGVGVLLAPAAAQDAPATEPKVEKPVEKSTENAADDAIEAAILKCPQTRRNCAVGLVVANKKSHSFKIFQASEEPLVGRRRRLTTVTNAQKPEWLDLGSLSGRVLIVEYDEGDRRTLYNARIITSVIGRSAPEGLASEQ